MADDFVVTGTRPPSAASLRPMSASSKDFGYYTKKPHSTVDETLFRPHHASALHAPVTFSTPWEGGGGPKAKDGSKKTTKPGRPLLWAPALSGSTTQFDRKGGNDNDRSGIGAKDNIDDDNNNNNNNNSSSSSNTWQVLGTIHGIPMKHQYRRLKHTPTFVDETLFGDPLSEPSFKAPWEEKRKGKKQVLHWYPQPPEERRPIRRRRPATALGLRGFSATSGGAVPVWKP